MPMRVDEYGFPRMGLVGTSVNREEGPGESKESGPRMVGTLESEAYVRDL